MNERSRRVVLVTGASSGLGNACATQLAKKGHTVYGTSRDPDARQQRADEFYELIRMDAEDDDSVNTAISYVLAKEQRIDLLLYCAGIGIAGSVEETPIVEAQRQLAINFFGVARAVKLVLPGMRTNGGSILVLGSMAGNVGVPFQAYYAASKYALEGYVDSLRMELRPYPVQVSLIDPGDFRTGFTEARTVYGLGEDSTYAMSGLRSIAAMEGRENTGSDPVILARLILRLLDKKKLKPRYAVGPRMQRLAMLLARILPRGITEILLMAYYKVL